MPVHIAAAPVSEAFRTGAPALQPEAPPEPALSSLLGTQLASKPVTSYVARQEPASAAASVLDDDLPKPVEPATWLVVTHSELPIVTHKRFKNSLSLDAFKEKLERILGTSPLNMEIHLFDRASKAEAVWDDPARNLGSFALPDYSQAVVVDLGHVEFADAFRHAHGTPRNGEPLPAAAYEQNVAKATTRLGDVTDTGKGVLLIDTTDLWRARGPAGAGEDHPGSGASASAYRLPHDADVHRGVSPTRGGGAPRRPPAASDREEPAWPPQDRFEDEHRAPQRGQRESPRRESSGPEIPHRPDEAPLPAVRGTRAGGGQVVAWGAGKHHQLGTGDEADRSFPALAALDEAAGPLRAVFCGWNHSAAIAGDGSLLTWGSGKYGRIGHETNLKQPVPRPVASLERLSVRQVAFGWSHTLILSEGGAVFAMGYGAFGQLGIGDERRAPAPRRVEGFGGERVLSVACGGYHSAAVTEGGRLFCWGSGPLGCTGRGREARDSSTPALVGLPAGDGAGAVVEVSCGAFHTACVTSRGDLYTFGWGAYGQLGHGALEGEWVPRRVAALEGLPIRSAAAGGFHTLCLAANGQVLAFGRGSEGQLGAGDLLSRAGPTPVKVPLRPGDAAASVQAGLRHSAVLTEAGRLYTFGSNSRGQLGHPAWPAAPLCEPRQVGVLHGMPVLSASLGWDHSLALLAGRPFDEATAEQRASALLAASSVPQPAPAPAARQRPVPVPGHSHAPGSAPTQDAPPSASPLRAPGGLALPFAAHDLPPAPAPATPGLVGSVPSSGPGTRRSSPGGHAGPGSVGVRRASPAHTDVAHRAAAMGALAAKMEQYLAQPGVGYAAGPPGAATVREMVALADAGWPTGFPPDTAPRPAPLPPPLPSYADEPMMGDTRREVTVARFEGARLQEPERARAALRAAISRVEARRKTADGPPPPPRPAQTQTPAFRAPSPAPRAPSPAPAARAPPSAPSRPAGPLRRSYSAPVPHGHRTPGAHAPTQPPGGPGYEDFEGDAWAASLRKPAPAAPKRGGAPPPARRGAPKKAPGGSEGGEYNAQLREALEGAVITEAPGVRWSEIVGLRDAKQALFEAVLLPLRFPHLFTGNRRPCSRILLYGPPGTGKTMLAKAAAGALEGGTFFSVSSADLLSRWYGESEKLVRSLFAMARERRPAVIFLDDADALFRTRQEAEHEASRRLKNEFLVQIQGLGSDNEGVVLLAATNIPWQLDSAFRRRFERSIYVPLPDRAARARMLQLQVGETPCALGEEEFLRLADRCAGYSGSDLECVARDALMEPVRDLLAATHFKPIEVQTPEGLRQVAIPCPPTDPTALRISLLELQRGHVVPPRMVALEDFEAALVRCPRTVSPHELARFESYTRQLGPGGAPPASSTPPPGPAEAAMQ
eukprot:tig00021352_g20694.t1